MIFKQLLILRQLVVLWQAWKRRLGIRQGYCTCNICNSSAKWILDGTRNWFVNKYLSFVPVPCYWWNIAKFKPSRDKLVDGDGDDDDDDITEYKVEQVFSNSLNLKSFTYILLHRYLIKGVIVRSVIRVFATQLNWNINAIHLTLSLEEVLMCDCSVG